MIHILPEAVLDDKQRRVIFAVQEHTLAAGVDLTVTRGHSSPADQLRVIERAAINHGCMFSEFEPGNVHDQCRIWRGGKELQAYLWQQTWSGLLHKGVIINPPLAAVCLEHYTNSAGVDMYNQIIYPSPHILSDPIDFSARVDRGQRTERVDINLVTEILNKAKAAGAGIRFVKPEIVNVCVHCDLEKDA